MTEREEMLSEEEIFDAYFMRIALNAARKAAEEGEVPAGCVIVDASSAFPSDPSSARILAVTHNRTESLANATSHAEMLAISEASKALGAWRLCNTRLYVTKEPCPMCAGAIILARIGSVVWGVSDPKRGGGTEFGIFSHKGINHHPEIVTGVLEEESKEVLVDFFRKRREMKERSNEI